MRSTAQHTRTYWLIFSAVAAALMALSFAYVISITPDERLWGLPILAHAAESKRLVANLYAVATFLVCTPVFYLLFTRLDIWLSRLADSETEHIIALTWKPSSVACTFLLIMLVWVPVAVLVYPGGFAMYDTPNMIYEFFTTTPTYLFAENEVVDASYIDHHPLLDTLMYGSSIAVGRSLGSDNLGMFLFVVVQAAFTGLGYALSVCYLQQLQVPWKLRVAALVLVAVFPLFPTSAMIMMKDSTFAPWFIMFVLAYLELYRSRGQVLNHPWFMVGIVVVMIMCILTRKLGLLQVGISILVATAVLKGVRLRSFATIALSFLIASVLVPALVFPRLDVAPGGKQEIFAPLLQQTITLARDHPEAFSQDDWDVVNKILDSQNAMELYVPTLSDAVKRQYLDTVSTQETLSYLKVWAQQGIQHPLTYLKSLAQCTAFLVVPGMSAPIDVGIDDSGIIASAEGAQQLGQEFHLDISRSEWRTQLIDKFDAFFGKTLSTIPVVGITTSMGFWGGWLPFVCLVLVLGRNRRYVFALTPFVISVALLVISPGTLPRYIVPLVSVVVPMMGWVIYTFQDTRDAKPEAASEMSHA